MTDNIVPMRGGSPTVADIPNQMRLMADRIERGEVEASSVLFIIPKDGDWPDIFGWGEHLGDYGNIAVAGLVQTWFINNMTARD